MKLNYRNERNAKVIASYYNKSLDKPDWYNFKAVSEEETEVVIYDYIGWPYNDAGDFVRAMSDIRSGKVTIRINSQGGDLFDAIAIYNAIKAHPLKPITRVESLAASAASYIALAGREKQAYKNSMIMIHRPLTVTFGNEDDHEETLGVLRQLGGIMIDSYAEDTGLGKKEITGLLRGEGKNDGTYMTAKQAKEKGFIDTILEAGKPVKAEFDLSIFANLPEEIKNNTDEKKVLTEREIEKILRDGGVSNKRAKAILARCKDVDGETRETEDNEEKIDQELFNLCKTTISLLKGENTNGRA